MGQPSLLAELTPGGGRARDPGHDPGHAAGLAAPAGRMAPDPNRGAIDEGEKLASAKAPCHQGLPTSGRPPLEPATAWAWRERCPGRQSLRWPPTGKCDVAMCR